jgi:dihydrofolate reductase
MACCGSRRHGRTLLTIAAPTAHSGCGSHDDGFSSRDRSPTAKHTRKEGVRDVEPEGGPRHRSSSVAPARRSEAMLIYSMSVSVDGFIADRDGEFAWTAPSDELFRFHLEQVRELGGYLLGRRLYETMLVWETDPTLRDSEARAAFADVWSAIPKVVFSHTLDSVQGNARLAGASVAEEVAAALDATDRDVSTGSGGVRARPRRRAAHVPPSGRRRWRHAVPAAGHRRRPARSDRDQDCSGRPCSTSATGAFAIDRTDTAAESSGPCRPSWFQGRREVIHERGARPK